MTKARMGIKLVGDWKRLDTALNGRKLSKHLIPQFQKANLVNAAASIKEVKSKIVKREDAASYANAFLTIAIKKSTKPLIGLEAGAPLFNALTWKKINKRKVFAGVHYTNRFHDIARALHDGTVFRVTNEMRGLFYHLWLASNDPSHVPKLTGRAAKLWKAMPGGWKKLKDSTTTIALKERPFIKRVFEDKTFITRTVRKNYNIAVENAFRKNK